jgi:tRNA (adenine22-N1)-methyltransferase
MTILTPRLLTIAQMIEPGTVADIGADHALLGIYLVQKQIAARAIVTDINCGPLTRAAAAVKSSAVSDHIEVRQGDGLRPIAGHEVDTIVIAGMGGTVISEIIAADWEKSESFSRFVLQPMTKPEVLRDVLARRGWKILQEQAVLDRDQWYVIILCCPGQEPYTLSDLELEVGPHLLRADTAMKRDYLAHWRNRYAKVHASLMNSTRRENIQHIRACETKIACLEELLNGAQS